MKKQAIGTRAKQAGFTLIELLVVIAVAAVTSFQWGGH
jgi:prepilin-type N-terminal cleavage/methylation domain-containing protein